MLCPNRYISKERRIDGGLGGGKREKKDKYSHGRKLVQVHRGVFGSTNIFHLGGEKSLLYTS